MANAWYAKGAERVLKGQINLSTANIKAVLIKNSYAENLNTDEFFTSIAAHVVEAPVALTGKSVTGKVFDADDVVFPTVTAGDTYEAVVLYLDTGVEATSPLLAYIDAITGFPVAANGGDIEIRWSNGAYKILSL